MSDELELITDGEGVALIGDAAAIERFLAAENLPSRQLDLKRFGTSIGRVSGAAQAGSEITAQSGRWVKLTEKSARAFKRGTLMKGSETGVGRAVLTKNGKIDGILEIVKPGAFFTNPAILAGAAGVMAQIAMQQSMEEITAYLQAIDEKVDDILRAQTDAVIADMIGVGMSIDEAMTIREEVGWVSDTTWSKVQGSSATISRTQAYALRQLEAITEKIEKQRKVADLAKATEEAAAQSQEWLIVLARCMQLRDALAVLELDRVLDSTPEELDNHRRALHVARQRRVDAISVVTQRFLDRIHAATGTANKNVLFRPSSSGRVVRSGQDALRVVGHFREVAGIEGDIQFVEARSWGEAFVDTRDKVLVRAGERVDAARRTGNEVFTLAKKSTSRLSEGVADRVFRRTDNEDETEDEDKDDTL